MNYQVLSIVTRGDKQISEDQQLIISELLFVLLPVVVMSPSEVWQSFLYGHLEAENEEYGYYFPLHNNKKAAMDGYTYFNGLCVIKVGT